MLASSIPIFQSSTNRVSWRKKERKKKFSIDRSSPLSRCFDLSLQRGASRWWLCHRVRFKPGFEGVLGRFHELTNALRHARSASWSSVGTLFSRERKEEGGRGRKEGGIVLRYTLRKSERLIVMEIVRWNETGVPYGSHVIALPLTVARMKRFTRWWFINNVVYLMVYRMVRSFVRLNRRLVGLKLWFETMNFRDEFFVVEIKFRNSTKLWWFRNYYVYNKGNFNIRWILDEIEYYLNRNFVI